MKNAFIAIRRHEKQSFKLSTLLYFNSNGKVRIIYTVLLQRCDIKLSGSETLVSSFYYLFPILENFFSVEVSAFIECNKIKMCGRTESRGIT